MVEMLVCARRKLEIQLQGCIVLLVRTEHVCFQSVRISTSLCKLATSHFMAL